MLKIIQFYISFSSPLVVLLVVRLSILSVPPHFSGLQLILLVKSYMLLSLLSFPCAFYFHHLFQISHSRRQTLSSHVMPKPVKFSLFDLSNKVLPSSILLILLKSILKNTTIKTYPKSNISVVKISVNV